MEKNIKELTSKELSTELTKIVLEMRENTEKNDTYKKGLRKLEEKRDKIKKEENTLDTKKNNIKGEKLKYTKKDYKGLKVAKNILFCIFMIILSIIGVKLVISNSIANPDSEDIMLMIKSYIGCILSCAVGIGTFIFCYSHEDIFIGKGFLISLVLAFIIFFITTTVFNAGQWIIFLLILALVSILISFGITHLIYRIIDGKLEDKDMEKYLKDKEKLDKEQEEKVKKDKETINEEIEKLEQEILNIDKEIEDYKKQKPDIRNFKDELGEYLYKDYIDIDVLNSFITYLNKGMCDNLKECINKYEQELQLNNLRKEQEGFKEKINKRFENEKQDLDNKFANFQLETNEQILRVQAETNQKIKNAEARTNENINKVGKTLSWREEQEKDIDSITKNK